MNKVKLLGFIAIGLLISNLVLLGFILFKKPKHPLGEGPKKIIIEKLHFDNNQILQYESIIKEHQTKIRIADDEILDLKRNLYSTLKNDGGLELKDSLINRIAEVQTQVEKTHYEHFLQIKKLCKANQQKDFEALTQEIADLFYRRQMPKEKHER